MIKICDVSKRYGGYDALRQVSLELSPGEILLLAGPSGCGKTTLLRIIAGLERPDEGKVLIDGAEASTPAYVLEPCKRNVSLIFQDLALWPHMSVREHVGFAIRGDRLPKAVIRSRTDDILRSVSLDGLGTRHPHQLSGGERQRLAIARALAPDARWLLMDEPFASLDLFLTEELEELIVRLKKNIGMGILYVTHSPRGALPVADRVALMREGHIVRTDTGEGIMRHPGSDFAHRMLGIRETGL